MREALRQTWISQAMDRYRVSPSKYNMEQIIAAVDQAVDKLDDDQVARLL